MIKHFKKILCTLFVFVIVSLPLTADEGMWLLTALDKLPLKELKARGLRLSLQDIYNPKGPCLKDAVVLLGGGTAEFVSTDGLMLTNHHVAYGALQSNSTPEKDYIKNGFHAKTLEEEIFARGYMASILEEMRDVTQEIRSKLSSGMSVADHDTTVRRTSNEIVKAAITAIAKGKPEKDYRASVQEMNNGRQYVLFVYRVIRDVRLVYSPPLGIGNFGGETDNWMWPRHTGDFSFMRAYIGKDGTSAEYSKDNVPFKPKAFLKFSQQGCKQGEFVMIIGFPGRTARYRTSYEIRFDQEINFPFLIKMMKTNIDALEIIQKRDKATEIKYASRVKGLYNGYKNRQGMVDGFKKLKLVEMKQKEETAFKEWLAKNSELNDTYGDILPSMQKIHEELKQYAARQMSFSWMLRGSALLTHAYTIAKWHEEQKKSDEQRAEGYHAKESTTIKNRLMQKIDDIELEQMMLSNVLRTAAEAPLNDRLMSMHSITNRMEGADLAPQMKSVTKDNFMKSKLLTPEGRLQYFSMSNVEYSIDPDPLIQFAKTLHNEVSQFTGRYDELLKQIDKLRGRYIEALALWKKAYLYPDANRSMRLTHGVVKAYNPRDAVSYTPYTQLSGVVEKNTGVEPFDAPTKLQELYEKKDFGHYADKSLNDVPVDFLSDTDITGGNSGSPVMNGKGELVGCAFDGVYEGMTSDYHFDNNTSRTISVDSRYILFVLDKFAGAKNILDELTIVK